MNVASVSSLSMNTTSASSKDESIDQDYMALITQFYQAEAYKSRDEMNAEDGELTKFKDDLVTKGAAVFLKELNEEKIEALVEEYRQKLLKEKAENPDKPMDINQMVSDFKKQLLEELMEAQKTQEENKPTQSTSLMSSDILKNIQAARNDEKTTGLAEIGFLEQMLSTSNTHAQKNGERV
ncbi:MAG TPA: hypothetical protein VJA83_00470 [Sulfuricurvum sp.]|nr:hypothetical protein [Sulfuricurvum sp.]